MWARAAVLGAAMAAASAALAGQYEFLAAPQINLSLVYRLDKLTGDVVACQFARDPGGPTSGPGHLASPAAIAAATAQRSRSRATTAWSPPATSRRRHLSRHYRNGGLSICYLYFQREKEGDHEAVADQYVVCTPSGNSGSRGRSGQRTKAI